MARIRKSELAEILNVSRARITQYVSGGMPVEPDGSVDLAAARSWVADNVDSGRRASRAGQKDRPRRPAPEKPPVPSAHPSRDDGGFAEGFIAAAIQAITHAPVVVAVVVAEAGGCRDLAERVASEAQMAISDVLDEIAEPAGLADLGVRYPPGTFDAWRARVPWDEVFDAAGNSKVAGRISSADVRPFGARTGFAPPLLSQR